MDKEKILKEISDKKIDIVWLQFVDILGFPKLVEISSKSLETVLEDGIAFDGSSVEGFARIEESDMLLKPDINTFSAFPWTLEAETKIARIICDVYDSSGTLFEGSPRNVLKKVIREGEAEGFRMLNGVEEEFFFFRLDEDRNPTTKLVSDGSYFEMLPEDIGEKTRALIALNLEKMGFEIEASHHEVSPSQHEIDFKYADPVTTADRIITFKIVAKTLAMIKGLYATFLPKPIYGINGSGAHTNISLIDLNGNNAFYDGNKDFELSDIALNFIGGIFKHVKAITAITNPLVNSYKRLVPGYEAPVYISWAVINRSALIRIPNSGKNGKRIEFRSPDPTANPYLAFAVILKAGLDGIKNKITPPARVNGINIYELTESEKRRKKIDTLPSTLKEAIEALKKDKILLDVLGKHVSLKYIEAKEREWEDYKVSVTDWEIKNSFPIY
ncbi:MAG: type I glutamate--ammonia ligase [Caldiserica bacterium CG02_land_8_20_14_3_00_36_38]|nr:type I glutamate--ammonia ligase [Caldisericota bacterium]OIP13787.1 MAG: type I glutamate--ammonia ligase [Caldisericum sp. CG2_30_36_11]PIP49646.1 MAG: type I glutamate--ammonia ligase [Caldiserica bacterium CG23_combo_of_CG06-09_8_20_14_all_35_60]PIV55243.1 MAG: type I glutamate--ammonia ligase [Caldiserica bacterium CG02_land_8_20_14_3_00_36_38]